MLTESEPRRSAARHLELLDGLASRIGPDDPALRPWYERYRREHRERLAADLRIVENHLRPGARILEYGTVPPLATAALSELGYRVRGVDVAPGRFATAIAELGLDVCRCDVETEPLPFAAASFDAVLLHEIFEHLRIDPIFTLTEAHRVLAPGGSLLLSTPNLRSFRGLKNLLLHDRGHAASAGIYEQYEKLETLGHMGHVREYTTRDVCEFVGRIGFTVDKVVFRGGYGRGVVGLAERLLPWLRPFFSLIAIRPAVAEGVPPGAAAAERRAR